MDNKEKKAVEETLEMLGDLKEQMLWLRDAIDEAQTALNEVESMFCCVKTKVGELQVVLQKLYPQESEVENDPA